MKQLKECQQTTTIFWFFFLHFLINWEALIRYAKLSLVVWSKICFFFITNMRHITTFWSVRASQPCAHTGGETYKDKGKRYQLPPMAATAHDLVHSIRGRHAKTSPNRQHRHFWKQIEGNICNTLISIPFFRRQTHTKTHTLTLSLSIRIILQTETDNHFHSDFFQ